MTITTETIVLKSGPNEMNAYVARPESGRAPGLIVLQEAFGVNDHIRDVSKRLAQQGYLVIAPELFHRTAPPGFTADYTDFSLVGPHMLALTPMALAEDTLAAYDWLVKESQCDRERIGAIGFCLGGRAAFIANAELPLKAAVSFYGGGIAQQLLGRTTDQHGPMLFFWGGLDTHITPELRAAVTAAMTEAGKAFINVEISDANHGFFCDARAAYNAPAARHAWALTLSFLSSNLK
ncbi:MAG: dienelactone hydrolase family protein [Bacteroidota bacterium]|nr:dienelactone hydrolase family protein [Bacteroidota bacterium]MDP4233832.1 dienelactone hydrolase family protein [Bacteroidota bacterium]MDP4242469.1 dienelactone hydrolase family protein [Bacteroidota bacterium]MDP4289057.1 dienelactone hydrolase family protein [Bacteroidota bacterium]